MFAEIDWEQQWAIHSPEFKEGKAHIKLPNQSTLQLLPGPGFGDFSHPTTKLVIDLMPYFIQDQTVFDIGCGSGILSMAAKKMGAKEIFACDIDPVAVEHTKKNAAFNSVDISWGKPEVKPVVLMNMIASEQRLAWQENQLPFQTLITSGVLATEKKDYLTHCFAQGWQLMHEANLDGWLAFVLKEKS
ncbi:MAG: 50S ribosomal protein L11 methyltransferase [Simkaniaceae bacterium]|nr:50S ribosomal protein L11 methyltransferase [Candidatus Sacchlamyda saccharinae]